MMERSLEDLSGEEAYLSQIEGLKNMIKDDEKRFIEFKKQARKEIEGYKQEINELRNNFERKDVAFESLNRIKQENEEKIKDLKKEKPNRDLKEILRRNLSEIDVGNEKKSERLKGSYMSTEELVNRHLKKRDEEWERETKPEKIMRIFFFFIYYFILLYLINCMLFSSFLTVFHFF